MRKLSKEAVALLGVLALPCLGACVKLKVPSPDKRYYVIEAARPGPEAADQVGRPSLAVRRARVSPRHESNGFIYRVGPHEFKQDYYNEFFVGPGLLMTEAAATWMRRSGLFSRVNEGGSEGSSDYSLELAVTAIHGDYTAAPPRAVVEIQCLLLKDGGMDLRPVLQADLREEEPLKEKTPEGLVEGWNAALARCFSSLESEVRKVIPESAQ